MNFNAFDEIVKNTKLLFDEKLEIKEKGCADFVTNTDIKIEQYLIKNLANLNYSSTFVTEESDKNFSKSYFVIDPLDGTTNYIRGIKCYGVSVAFVENDEIIYGALYDPNSDLLLSTYEGNVYLNGKEYHLDKSNKTLKDCLVDLGTSPYKKDDAHKLMTLAEKLLKSTLDLRRSGSTVINLMNLALGKIDIFLEPNLSIWDYLAGVAILKNLGCVSSNFKGETISNKRLKDNFISTNQPTLIKNILEIIEDVYE